MTMPQNEPASITPAEGTAVVVVAVEEAGLVQIEATSTRLLALPAIDSPTHVASTTLPSTLTASTPVIATATPDPIYPFTLAGLQARPYAGGEIRVRAVLAETAGFTRSYIEYPSDGLTITGIMQSPPGIGPFPVIILLHGYFDRTDYWSGADTEEAAEFFNRHGYLTIAPDFRSWGESDTGASLFHSGLVIDTLNLISSLPSLPQVDPAQVGLWGHSMGGGVATKVLVVDSRIKAAVLYAPNSADDADIIGRWGPGCLPGQSEVAGDKCNPAEIIPPDLSPEIVQAYQNMAATPELLRQVAPLYHLEQVTAPVQIHIGTADGAGAAETPPEWSEKLYQTLQAAGKEVAYFVYPNQGHFFSGESWGLLLERAVTLFDEQLKDS
jgi:dipeptidyl aminopeptidase/acylaminoacyl peptidase